MYKVAVIYLLHDENPNMQEYEDGSIEAIGAYFSTLRQRYKGRVGLFTTNLSLTVTSVCTLHRYKLVVDFWQSKSGTHHQHTGN
jgi:hypothetical protein